jgi:hypothetical protein
LFLCPGDGFAATGPAHGVSALGVWSQPHIRAGYANYRGGGLNWAWGESRWRNVGAGCKINGYNDGDSLLFRSDSLHNKRFAAVIDGLSNSFLAGEGLPEKSIWCSWACANDAVGSCAIASTGTTRRVPQPSPRRPELRPG